MSSVKEEGIRWWVRFAMIPIFIALIGSGILAVDKIAKPSSSLPTPLPTGLPTKTPLPTVIGTPIIGAEIAASGEIGFVLMANDISFVVDEVSAYATDSNGYPEIAGYALVVVKMRIVNDNWLSVYRQNITLVDDFSNQYVSWGVFGFDLPEIGQVPPGQSVAGALVYRVPIAALTNALRARLDLPYLDTRLEVFFDSINVETP